jgi:hypothetical protein
MSEEIKKEGEVVVPVVEIDPIAEKDTKIAKLEEERDNYKAVALKRLGKLPGDVEFLAEGDESKKDLTVAEQVRLILLDKEIESEKRAKEDETRKLVRENSELKLALKNRPDTSLGGESGGTVEVKDNVFSTEQLKSIRERAIRLKADPEKFIESAKKNFMAHR